LTVFSGGSSLDFPQRPSRLEGEELASFQEAVSATGPAQSDLRLAQSRRTVENNPPTGATVYTIATDVSEDSLHAREGQEEIFSLVWELQIWSNHL
jgi:hypothetical protein